MKEKLGLLFYEVQMFDFAITQWIQCAKDKLENNARIEVCLLHTRNLIEFFMGTSPKPSRKKNSDDIIVADFKDQVGENLLVLGGKDWNVKLSDKRNIDKWLSHLTEERLKLHKSWGEEIPRFEREIKKQVSVFLEKVSDNFPIFINDKKITKNDFKLLCGERINTKSVDMSIIATCSDVS